MSGAGYHLVDACFPNVSLLCRVAAEETPEEVRAQAPVMEAQAGDTTRTFSLALANSPLPSRIGVRATRARPKLLPRAVVSAEKVLLRNLVVVVPVQIMVDVTVVIYITTSVSGEDDVLPPP